MINPSPADEIAELGRMDGLTVVSSPNIKDGTQVWMRGSEVVDITTNERATFIAQFGLMQIPAPEANKVVISEADYEVFKRAAVDGSRARSGEAR